ncbi:MAG TPA: protoporphyrinogen oxidase [Opitutaceae bacterium]|nr:protoporphyrinogen oxidase [Opitutaceae bacterium]
MPAGPLPSRAPVAVLGGGVTGLAAAWHLHRAGLEVAVFESSARVGGVVETISEGGWLHEGGPNSLLEGSDGLGALLAALGLADRRLYAADAARHRYVLRGGRLRAMPVSPSSFLGTNLFSWRAKLGLASEIIRPRRREPGDESVADFTRRRLGQEFLDYAVDPFVGGVYAGDPARLSVRHAFPKLARLEERHGSLLRGAICQRNPGGGPRGRIFSFPQGLQELTWALAAPLGAALRLGARAEVLRAAAGGWEVTFEQGGEWRSAVFSDVVCALPAAALARLRFEGIPQPPSLACLTEIDHPPVASVFTGFRREDVVHPLDGFGMLIPWREGRSILGTLFSSSLFPGRAPAGHVALTTFVGGTRQPHNGLLEDGRLLELVRGELTALAGARAQPVYVSIRHHVRAIPQYNLGHQRFLDACARAEASAPGIHLGGACRDGVSLPACLASGQRMAEAAIRRRLQARATPDS